MFEDLEVVEGIIPAYAGSTSTTEEQYAGEGDHPRIRGEHVPQTSPMRTVLGSSPHTRGAQARPLRPHRRGGIIPAYAGSTVGGKAE